MLLVERPLEISSQASTLHRNPLTERPIEVSSQAPTLDENALDLNSLDERPVEIHSQASSTLDEISLDETTLDRNTLVERPVEIPSQVSTVDENALDENTLDETTLDRNTLVERPTEISSQASTLDENTLGVNKLDEGYSARQAAQASAIFEAPKPSHSCRDPHELPVFSNQSSPILFLPPLLSSLPHGLSHSPAPLPDQQPLNTKTHLPEIDPASLSLHRALHYFSPINPHYATQPYAESFNWDSLRLPEEDEREWYVVAFKSKRRAGSDSTPLYEADRQAHEEAVQNGGLIMYWYGQPDSEGNNLATCIWQSRRHAIAANSRPRHIVAARLAVKSFESFTLERHVIRKVKGETGVTVEEYTGGDVGW